MENTSKKQFFYQSRVTHREGEGRAFTDVHGVNQAVGSGLNAFLAEMANGNGGIRCTEVLWGSFGGGVGRERERIKRVERGN
jgi:hypothetical protein